MNTLVKRDYKLAVITVDEDRRLNRIARSKTFDAPEKRWAAAGISF
jgi:N-glycosylase/DNA lyase